LQLQFFQTLLVATPNEATAAPEGNVLSSGSLVKFPIINALFKFMLFSRRQAN